MLPMNGYAIAYDMEGEGVPLVFIHQASTDRRLWHHQRSSFKRKYRLITIDVMGHGEASWPFEELSIERAADHVQELLARLKTGPAFLVGASMGAAIAMRMTLSYPLLARGLILISPWSQTSEHTRNLVGRLFRLAEDGKMSTHADLFLRYVVPTLYLDHYSPEVRHLRALAMEQNPKAVAYTWAACMASNLLKNPGDIRVPSLVISGLNDLFTPPYLARAVAEKLSEVELEIWEDTGHFPFIENPLRFNRRLEMFIRRCLAQGKAE
jgi:pimeloyl-ACP methyl ester carboxylesterase